MTTPTLTTNARKCASFFKTRGYPDSTVTTGKHRAQEIDRETALQTSQNEETDRISFTLTYHPQNLAIKNVILKNLKILRNDPELKTYFLSHHSFGGRVGLVVRALAFHQYGPGSISALGVKCGLSLLVLYSAMRGFPSGTPVFPSHQKPTFDLICRKQL